MEANKEYFCEIAIPPTKLCFRFEGRVFELDGVDIHFYLAHAFQNQEVTNIQQAEAIQEMYHKAHNEPLPSVVALYFLTETDKLIGEVKKKLGSRQTQQPPTGSPLEISPPGS